MSELSIVVGVSTVLGLAALAMWLHYMLVRSKLEHEAADSLAEDLEGPARLKADAILKVILSFKDETMRLEAVRAFTGYDVQKTELFIQAANKKLPVIALKQARNRIGRATTSGAAFAFFLVVGVAAHLAQTQPGTKVQPTALPPDASPSAPTVQPASTPTSSSATQAQAPERKTLDFRMGPVDSGPGKQFSGQYEVCSEIPDGYKIETASFRLTGDRACGTYSTCTRSLDLPTKVCYSFSLQGHEEIAEKEGVKQSTGILTVIAFKP